MRTRLIVTLLLLLSTSPAWATTYYVAVTGNDANPGTVGSPFRNPQQCNSVLAAGDTCLVDDGTYTDVDGNGVTVYINGTGAGTSASNPITYKSKNPGGAKIQLNDVVGTGNSANIGFHITKNYYVIDGFEVTGSGTSVTNSTDNTLTYAGLNVTDSVVGTVIKNNIVHDIGRTVCSTSSLGFAGIFTFNADGAMISGNRIYTIGRKRVGEAGCAASVTGDFNDHGVYVHGGSITIVNNVIYDSNRGWPVQFSSGGVHTISSFELSNNTIDGHSSTGSPAGQVELSSAIGNGIIKNNIFSNPQTSVFDIGGTYSVSGGITYDYNLTDSTDTNMVVQAQPGTMTNGGHNLTSTSPGFTSLATNNYTLTPGSAAVNAGLTIASVTTDILAVSRPQGTAYDIGAYEFRGLTFSVSNSVVADNNSSPVATFSLPSMNVAAGSLVVSCWKWEQSVTLTSVQHVNGSNQTLLTAQYHSSTSPRVQCGYTLIATADAAYVLRATFSSNTVRYVRGAAMVFTYAGTAWFDVQVGSTESDSTLGPSSNNLTTSGSNEVCFGFHGDYNAQTFTNQYINGVAADGNVTMSDTSMWYRLAMNTFTGGSSLTRTAQPNHWVQRMSCFGAN